MSAAKINALLRKWLRLLPHPFTACDRQADCRFEVSFLQIELSLTQVLGRPLSGHIFFEEVIRENPDIGRPKQVQLIFDRRLTRCTPCLFLIRVIPDGVVPSLHVDYKGTRNLRQYLAPLPGPLLKQLTPGRMTYPLRRLLLHRMIQRVPQTHRYRVAALGLRAALFCTRTYNRVLRPGFAQLLPSLPATIGSLRRCFNQLRQEV